MSVQRNTLNPLALTHLSPSYHQCPFALQGPALPRSYSFFLHKLILPEPVSTTEDRDEMSEIPASSRDSPDEWSRTRPTRNQGNPSESHDVSSYFLFIYHGHFFLTPARLCTGIAAKSYTLDHYHPIFLYFSSTFPTKNLYDNKNLHRYEISDIFSSTRG